MSLVVHFEIHATEPERLVEFYSGLFGWTFTRFSEEVPYWVIDTGEGSVRQADTPGFGINGGLVQRMGERPAVGGPVTGANLVIGIDDIDARFPRALAAGATEALAVHDMPGVGRLGYLLDPDNNIFGMITPEMPEGS